MVFSRKCVNPTSFVFLSPWFLITRGFWICFNEFMKHLKRPAQKKVCIQLGINILCFKTFLTWLNGNHLHLRITSSFTFPEYFFFWIEQISKIWIETPIIIASERNLHLWGLFGDGRFTKTSVFFFTELIWDELYQNPVE